MIKSSGGARNAKTELIINKVLVVRRVMWIKHPAEALEFTMRWKDGHPSPGTLNVYECLV